MIDYSIYTGLTYKKLGRDFTGVDCWGLIKLIFNNEYRISLPEYHITHEDADRVNNEMTNVGKIWIEVEQPEERVVCLMNTNDKNPSMLNHIGLFINGYQIIQATEAVGSFVCRKDHPFWKSKIKKLYKWNR